MKKAVRVDAGRRAASRTILLSGFSWPVHLGAFPAASEAAQPSEATEPSTEALRESWMERWMQRPDPPEGAKLPMGQLVLSRFVEPIYFLLEPVGWKPGPGQPAELAPVVAPKGFVTDLASIPRPFWTLLRPDGEYVYAAILHDYMYWAQTRSRAAADATFRLVMEDFDVSRSVAGIIYEAVRIAGQSSWDTNRELAAKGERRVMKTFPTDPLTRWKDWKRKRDVFS